MKVLTKIKLSMLALSFASAGFAANRIVKASPLNYRHEGSLTPEECLDEQKEALEKNCINEEEYDSLIKINHYPKCVKFHESFKLIGWDPCN